jgi:hypothetical protein
MERLFEGKDKIIVDADAGGSGVHPISAAQRADATGATLASIR